MLHRLTLRSPIASSSRSVSGDSIEAAWTFLATTTSPLLAQVLGGVDAADAGTAEAVPRAAGVFTWTKLCARCCPDAAAAAAVPAAVPNHIYMHCDQNLENMIYQPKIVSGRANQGLIFPH
jgi:hypothetical protein